MTGLTKIVRHSKDHQCLASHLLGPVLVLDSKSQVLPWRKRFQTQNIDLVIRLNLVVIRRIDKGKRKHALLLQIGLVDTGERADNDGQSTKITWLERSMLTGGTLAIVGVT
jgi:hypothetical protein